MKLTNIALYSNDVEIAEFNFRDPGSENPYSVSAITGLDADVIVPKYYGTNIDGDTKYHSPSMGGRDIAMRIVLDPQWATGKGHSELRDDLYRGIASSRTGQVELHFRDGKKTKAVATGFVTVFDTDHFAPVPAVNLTIHCNDGLLKAPVPTTLNVDTLGPTFDIVDTESTAQHGFRFAVDITFGNSQFSIADANPANTWEFSVSPTRGFLLGDRVYFSSVEGDRYFYVNSQSPTGSVIHMVESISADSHWPMVFPGYNPFAMSLSLPFEWVSLEHTPTYWGV